MSRNNEYLIFSWLNSDSEKTAFIVQTTLSALILEEKLFLNKNKSSNTQFKYKPGLFLSLYSYLLIRLHSNDTVYFNILAYLLEQKETTKFTKNIIKTITSISKSNFCLEIYEKHCFSEKNILISKDGKDIFSSMENIVKNIMLKLSDSDKVDLLENIVRKIYCIRIDFSENYKCLSEFNNFQILIIKQLLCKEFLVNNNIKIKKKIFKKIMLLIISVIHKEVSDNNINDFFQSVKLNLLEVIDFDLSLFKSARALYHILEKGSLFNNLINLLRKQRPEKILELLNKKIISDFSAPARIMTIEKFLRKKTQEKFFHRSLTGQDTPLHSLAFFGSKHIIIKECFDVLRDLICDHNEYVKAVQALLFEHTPLAKSLLQIITAYLNRLNFSNVKPEQKLNRQNRRFFKRSMCDDEPSKLTSFSR